MREVVHMVPQKDLRTNVHSSFMYNHRKLETAQISESEGLDKQNSYIRTTECYAAKTHQIEHT